MRAILNRLSAATPKRLFKQDDRDDQTPVQSARKLAQSVQSSQIQATTSASLSKTTAPSTSSSSSSYIPISDVTGSRGLVSQKGISANKNGSADTRIPISDVTGNRGLVSQRNSSQDDGSDSSGSGDQAPHIPISVVTGGRDITTVSPQLRAYLQQGSSSASSAIPKEYADLANLLDKAPSGIDFENWADLTAKQQLSIAQKSGLTERDQQTLLNAAPHYVQTIAKVQAVFANRYALGLTAADARGLANELFAIADERDEATRRVGKYANDAVFAPRALRWLDEQEEKLLAGIGENTNETGRKTWYNGGNPDLAARAIRRASYADIDDAAATKQIEEMLMKNVAAAEKIAALSEVNDGGLAAGSAQMLWFYQNVKQDAPMDYKNQIIWDKALPGLPYPEEDKVYHVFGYDISSSDLGNLNYALVGKALGIPENLLLQQAGAAQLRDHKNSNFIKSEIESFIEPYYGDEEQDQGMIKMGFGVYDSLK